MKVFGERLKELRNSMSQKELADAIGLKQQTYQQYESAKREPPYEILVELCRHFEVSADWLLGLSVCRDSVAWALSTPLKTPENAPSGASVGDAGNALLERAIRAETIVEAQRAELDRVWALCNELSQAGLARHAANLADQRQFVEELAAEATGETGGGKGKGRGSASA